MQSFISFLNEYIVIIAVIFFLAVIAATAISVWRNGNRRREAACQLVKARETIYNNREAAGLPPIPLDRIDVIAYGGFDIAHRVYFTNPGTLLKELHKLNAGLAKFIGNGCTCSLDWTITIPGYSGQANIHNCVWLDDAVSDHNLNLTINTLSEGGLNSEGLFEGSILERARNLARKAKDAHEPRPKHKDGYLFIGVVIQDLGGGKPMMWRGRNPARETIELAQADALNLRHDLKYGTFAIAFMNSTDTLGVPVPGDLTPIVMCGTPAIV